MCSLFLGYSGYDILNELLSSPDMHASSEFSSALPLSLASFVWLSIYVLRSNCSNFMNIVLCFAHNNCAVLANAPNVTLKFYLQINGQLVSERWQDSSVALECMPARQ